MIEIIVFSIFILCFLFLVFDNVRVKIKNKSINQAMINIAIDTSIITQRLKQELELKENDISEHTEGFLKFVSQSRDWAFEYIEEVQSGIKEFIDDIEPEIEYFDEYGLVASAYPHYYSMKKISQSYKKLKTLLPEDYGKI
jgi:hypothetical protein